MPRMIFMGFYTSDDLCLWIEGVFWSLQEPSRPVSSSDSNLAMGASDDDFCFPSPDLALGMYDGFIGSARKLAVTFLLKSCKFKTNIIKGYKSGLAYRFSNIHLSF